MRDGTVVVLMLLYCSSFQILFLSFILGCLSVYLDREEGEWRCEIFALIVMHEVLGD